LAVIIVKLGAASPLGRGASPGYGNCGPTILSANLVDLKVNFGKLDIDGYINYVFGGAIRHPDASGPQ
jgi:hypothetical protein